jgi:hypothetical protein
MHGNPPKRRIPGSPARGTRGRASVMRLPASQDRALDRIQQTLLVEDPHLRSLFAIFTRLTRHEAMPVTERVRPRWHRIRLAILPIAVIGILSLLVLSSSGPDRYACGAGPASAAHAYSPKCLNGPAIKQEPSMPR